MSLYQLLTTEKKLRMMWKVEKDGKASYLVGAAHFFPYSFKKSLSQYINNAETVLLEGPLDETNMNKVIEQGVGREIIIHLLTASLMTMRLIR